MPKDKREILVTSALPYANGELHLGHMLEQIQTDIWVRYQKLIGNECTYVCADDAHGTPIMLRAEELGIDPESLISDVYDNHLRDSKGFLIDHDNYHSTHSDENKYFSELIFERCKEKGYILEKEIDQLFDIEKQIFLSDRYVKGICPSCGAKDQYGDNCEVCGKTYLATDLIDPISTLSDTIPEVKKSLHLFFALSQLNNEAKSWFKSSKVQKQALNKLNEWIDDLRDWDISRDAPYFGFEIPNYPNKYFYVWLDAPIGYLASHKNFLSEDNEEFSKYWNEDTTTELYHFIGKDIIYFHALFFPALLLKANFRQPTGVFAHGFLTIDGEKMSKSKGTFILADTYLKHLDPQFIRYYFSTKLTEGIEDIDLNLEDFIQKTNSDLVGKYINLASRSSNFITKYFNGRLSEIDENHELLQLSNKAAEKIFIHYENREFSKATKEIMLLADKTNQYFDNNKPWEEIKKDNNSLLAHEVCSVTLLMFKNISIFLSPILPNIFKESQGFLNLKNLSWADLDLDLSGHTINEYSPLITRIEKESISRIIEDSKE